MKQSNTVVNSLILGIVYKTVGNSLANTVGFSINTVGNSVNTIGYSISTHGYSLILSDIV